MEEIEHFFRCPHCRQKISMLIDVSQSGEQTYIEDCEVCCKPIQLMFNVSEENILENFEIESAL